ncbi:polysaccharide pyruvyl transferase family protein [Blastococcus sp. KM273129]|uniref:polysaccharide pyruvyl transferase family protein n=1 Tax=Blastococcus sp. KM273129 TaxID=2570315 RepID=UPI001F17BD51|nr:polysaccharide pyruvyl transferase family protein [Blastococcus sp. KM273129]
MTVLFSRALRVWRRSVVGSGLPGLVDRTLVRRSFRARTRTPRATLIVSAPGNGNIGDQALLEALIENIGGPVTVIVPDAAEPEMSDDCRRRVSVCRLPGLLYGNGAEHRAAVAGFGEALADAAHLCIVGADVMDGRYSLPASVRRSTLATAAARAGVDTRVIGFSWSDRPRSAARRSLAAAGRSGVRLLLRDPVSAARARRDGIVGVREAADVVFAARSVERSAAADVLEGVDRPVALVNVSGLLAERLDQTDDYVAVVDGLRSRGLHVVLLPHVARERAGDLAACAAVAERAGPTDVTHVRRLLTPAQVRGLAERSTITVTGRMHLAVMSLLQGVPAVTLATQGKVEGLMQLFGVPGLCVSPEHGFSADVMDAVEGVLDEASSARRAIRTALPRVVELALRNVEGLPVSVR